MVHGPGTWNGTCTTHVGHLASFWPNDSLAGFTFVDHVVSQECHECYLAAADLRLASLLEPNCGSGGCTARGVRYDRGAGMIDASSHSYRTTMPKEPGLISTTPGTTEITTATPSFVRKAMRDELFSGFSEVGWDQAPWDAEPTFSAEELQILLNPALSVAEAADRVGCVQHDVRRLRRTA